MLRAGDEGGARAQGIELLRGLMAAASNIRRGHSADLSAVLQLLNGAGLPTADLQSAPEFQSWILEEKGSILGVIGLERFGGAALLRSLAVAPEHRKRGIGRELVAHLELDAKSEGIKQLLLLTETAEAFFRGLGYAVTDRSQVSDAVTQSVEFRSLCPVSAICMSKSLRDG